MTSDTTLDADKIKLGDHAADPEDMTRPIIVCPIGRGWLKSWEEVGLYCGFGGKKGTSSFRTGRAWELRYKLPIRRLPGGRIRAIPYELDRWLIEFSERIKDAG